MAFKSDIEIAQECKLKHISEIAEKAGVDEKYVEYYGRHRARQKERDMER